MAFEFLNRLFAPPQTHPLDTLWQRIVAVARNPRWYREGRVPDTLDGRFDMVALIVSLVLVRLEQADDKIAQVQLTERFVDDMDGNLRQQGIGDVVIGKHVGKMMGALGGRLGAYRDGLAEGGDLEGALARNLYRGAPDEAGLSFVAREVRRLSAGITATPVERLLAGEVPE